jgi:hypothetical protein
MTRPYVGRVSFVSGGQRMSTDDLMHRIRRIYASIDSVQEFDMTKLPAKVFRDDSFIFIYQDFAGNLSEEYMANLAHGVIDNIANLRDYLLDAGCGTLCPCEESSAMSASSLAWRP